MTHISPYALVIGGANIDFTATAKDSLIWHDSNPGIVHTSLGGVGRNIAENLARLTINTKLLSLVGDDAHGKQLIRETQAVGVNMSAVLALPDQRTSSYFAIMDDDDLAVAIADMGIIDSLTPDIIETQRSLIQGASLVVLDTNLSAETLTFLLTQFPQVRFFVDPVSVTKSQKILPLLAHIDTLKPNRLEAAYLTGIPIETLDDAHAALDKLLTHGIKHVFISLGADGCLYGDQHLRHYQAAYPTRVNNATGAGDAMMASIAYGAMHQLSIQQTLKIAHAVASITLQATTTIASDLSETCIESLLKEV